MADTRSEQFYSLTPERILSSIEEVGVRCTGRILALNSMENRVLEVEIEPVSEVKTRFDTFRVAKFYRPGRWTKDQILEEHRFLRQLINQDISVVAPLEFPDGETLHEMKEEGIFFAVFARVGGRTLDEPDEGQLERIGRLIARIHTVGAFEPFRHRITLNADTYGSAAIEFLEKSNFVTEVMRERLLASAKSIVARARVLLSGVPLQRCHGDLHWGNILWDRNVSLVVDFDDAVMAPVAQDMWLLVPGRDEQDRKRLERLLTGYSQMRHVDRSQLRLVEALRTLLGKGPLLASRLLNTF